MVFSGQCMLVSQKLIKKDNMEIPLVCISDGTDVLQIYDNNGVCHGLEYGTKVDVLVDVSVKGALRMLKCVERNANSN